MTARRIVRADAELRGWDLVHADELSDQFERDKCVLAVECKMNDSIRVAQANEPFGVVRIINGTSKLRKVRSYLCSGFIK